MFIVFYSIDKQNSVRVFRHKCFKTQKKFQYAKSKKQNNRGKGIQEILKWISEVKSKKFNDIMKLSIIEVKFEYNKRLHNRKIHFMNILVGWRGALFLARGGTTPHCCLQTGEIPLDVSNLEMHIGSLPIVLKSNSLGTSLPSTP